MKRLEDYLEFEKDWVTYRSPLCSITASTDFPHPTSRSLSLTELIFSYLNQWQLVIDSYKQLQLIHERLGKADDNKNEPDGFSPYDKLAVYMEDPCRDYGYLLIISMKTMLDLFACLVEVTMKQESFSEDKMTDFANFNRNQIEGFEKIYEAFGRLKGTQRFNWYQYITTVRNSLVHRGYTLKAEFGFKKKNDIILTLLQGNNYYTDIPDFAVNNIFERFIKDLPIMEKMMADVLKNSIEVLKGTPLVEVIYQSSGGARRYAFNDLGKSNNTQ